MSLLIFLNISIYRKINETRKVRERQMANRLALRRFSDLGSSGGIARGGGPQNANNAPATSVTMGVMLDVQDPQRQQQQRQQQQQQVSKKDIKMAMILITIVLVFFFCHLPRLDLEKGPTLKRAPKSLLFFAFCSLFVHLKRVFLPPTKQLSPGTYSASHHKIQY